MLREFPSQITGEKIIHMSMIDLSGILSETSKILLGK